MSSTAKSSAAPNAAAAGQFLLGGQTPVNRMGYGSMRLSGPNIMGPPRDRDQAIAVLRRAVELGVNHIDTSDYYGPYTVNELIREALHPYPDDLVLVTKVGARRTPDGGWPAALSAAELISAVQDNLRHLGVDRIDVVNLRMADKRGGVFVDGSLAEPFEVLADLREQGLIAPPRGQQRRRRAAGAGAADRAGRVRAEHVQHRGPRRRRADRRLRGAGHRLHAVLPGRWVQSAAEPSG